MRGNTIRREDTDDELFWRDYGDRLMDAGISLAREEWSTEQFVAAVEIARQLGYARGFADGRDELARQRERG